MDASFRGKRALVTGASQGIGKAIVIELVKRGASVIALSKTKKNLELLKKEVPEVEIVCLDVSKWNDTENVIKSLGDIDLLVNNAGVISLQGVGSITEEEIDSIFDLHDTIYIISIWGYAYPPAVVIALGPKYFREPVITAAIIVADNMKKQNKAGSIVNISSQTAMVAIENHSTYAASKGALDQLSKVMALELAPHQIRVNTVNPTVVLTEMGKTALGDEAEIKKSKIPIGRFCVPEDIVGAVIFLLSDQAAMITGAHIPIDGGYTIQ